MLFRSFGDVCSGDKRASFANKDYGGSVALFRLSDAIQKALSDVEAECVYWWIIDTDNRNVVFKVKSYRLGKLSHMHKVGDRRPQSRIE